MPSSRLSASPKKSATCAKLTPPRLCLRVPSRTTHSIFGEVSEADGPRLTDNVESDRIRNPLFRYVRITCGSENNCDDTTVWKNARRNSNRGIHSHRWKRRSHHHHLRRHRCFAKDSRSQWQ